MSPNPLIRGFDAFKPSLNASTKGPPRSIAASTASFFSILSLDSVVSYRLLASSVNAEFSFQALFPVLIALSNTPLALAARSKLSLSRTSLMSMSSNILIADVPCFSAFASPSINFIIALEGSSLNNFEN